MILCLFLEPNASHYDCWDLQECCIKCIYRCCEGKHLDMIVETCRSVVLNVFIDVVNVAVNLSTIEKF